MMSLFDLLRRLVRGTSGLATLEAAIVLPVAISLMVGGIEFGNLFLSYGTASKSVRDAARYLAHVPQADICGWGQTDAQNLAVFGTLDPGGAMPLLPHWDEHIGDVKVVDCSNPCPPGVSSPAVPAMCITLQADVPYTMLTFAGIPFTSIQFSNRTIRVTHQEVSVGE